MAVLVVYERDLSQVVPWPRLSSWLDDTAADGLHLECVLIYDNSRESRARPPIESAQLRYVHDPTNGGTAAAYARAIQIAHDLGVEWLLLLDHDTLPPATFLKTALPEMRSGHSEVAVVPWVAVRQTGIVSPSRVTRLGSVKPIRAGETPTAGEHLTAVASGSIFHVPTIKQLLPFPRELWLDYLDHWIFAQLHRRRLTIAISDQCLQHEMAIATPGLLSTTRLDSMLAGEAMFTRLLGPLARCVYPFRLIWRILRLAKVSPKLAAHAATWIFARGSGRG